MLTAECFLGLHDPDAQIVFPDHVGGLHRLNTELSSLLRIRFADPHHFIFGATVVALQPDDLSYAADSGNFHQAGPKIGNLISAAELVIGTVGIKKHLDRDGYVETLLAAFISGSRYAGSGCCPATVGLHFPSMVPVF